MTRRRSVFTQADARPANAEMVEGYMDGRNLDAPEPSANRSASYRHGFAVSRAERLTGNPLAPPDVLRERAQAAMQEDEKMTRAVEHIIRPDRRVAARLETLAYLFDVSPETIRRAVEAGKLKPSKALGPPLYRVDDVEKLLFGGDMTDETPAPSDDPSVRAVHNGEAQRGRRRASA